MKRIAAAFSVVALMACGTPQKKADEAPQQDPAATSTGGNAAKGAVGGAAIGAVACLSIAPAGLAAGGIGVIGSTLAALVCLPFGAVGGAVIGGTVAAVRSPGAPSGSPAQAAEPSPEEPAWQLIGSLGRGEPLPEGTLHVAGDAKGKTPIRLLVDLEQTSEKGERSYLGYAWADCDNDSVRIFFSETYSEWGGNGWRVSGGQLDPEVTLRKPQARLDETLKHLCG
jgi:hypothetical protein